MVIKVKSPVPAAENEYDKHLGPNKFMTAKPVVATTSVESKGSGADTTLQTQTALAGAGVVIGEEHIGKPVMFSSPPYGVQVETGRTVNLGNYNSAKLNVTLLVPCMKEDIESAYEFAANWTGAKIDEMMKAIKGD